MLNLMEYRDDVIKRENMFLNSVLLLCSLNLKISYWNSLVVQWLDSLLSLVGPGVQSRLGNKDPASLEAWPPHILVIK